MKKTKRILSLAIALLMILSLSTVSAFAADKTLTFSLRIEGISSNYFYSDISLGGISEGDEISLATLLSYVDDARDDLTIKGLDSGYITEINGDKAGTHSDTKWDGWYYTVNGISPSVGISQYNLSDGDKVVIYYGDYPCQIPEADTSWFAAKGVIRFTSTDTAYEYDEETDSWIPNTVTAPISNMKVTLDKGLEFTTDENGEIKVELSKYKFNESFINLQVSKVNSYGAPTVCRYAPDFTISAPVRNCKLYGDVDLNGKVNILDATLVQLGLAELDEITPEQYIAGDVNTDYNLTINDATNIQLYLADLISELPVK